MLWIALKMLAGNRGKYLGITSGVMFSALLVAHQASVFCGLMLQTASQVYDVEEAAIWVMDPSVEFANDVKPMSDGALYRVRGVPGVDWTARMFKGVSRAKLRDGSYQQVILVGVDDATFVGIPHKISQGRLADLRQQDAVMIDARGYEQLWPGEAVRLGRTLEIQERRAQIVGIVEAKRTFQTFPLIYTRYSQAVDYASPERRVLSFVMANPAPGVPAAEVCQRINEQTGLKALDTNGFGWMTIDYFFRETGIPLNFAITVLLGFIVGVAIAGQTFYLFTLENLSQFAALKAMGASNLRIVQMILAQALVVGLLGFALGVGLAAFFGWLMQDSAKLAFYMPWQVVAGTGGAMLAIVLLASLLAVRRVLVLEPVAVFQGGAA